MLTVLCFGALVVVLARADTIPDDRGEPAVIDARQLRFEQDTHLAYGEGQVVIRYQGDVLQADRARFNSQTREAWAEGHVRLHRDGQEWVAPAAYYNFGTRELRAEEAGGFVDPFIVHGYAIHQSATDGYAVARTTATTCDYEEPHYRLEATHSEIFPNQRVLLYNVTLRLGDVPVFWFPLMIFSLHEETQPVVVSVGSGSRWGFYVLLSTYWRLSDQVRLTVHVDGRTERGAAGGVDLKYQAGAMGQGELKTYYTYDSNPEDKIDRLLGKDLPNERYRVQLRHTQDLPGNLELKVDVNKQSDTDVVEDFFPSEFRQEREPQTVFDLTRRGENYSVSVMARPQLNTFFAEVERLPEATWSVNRVRLGPTPLFYEQETRVGYLNNVPGDVSTNSILAVVADQFRGHALRASTFQQVLVPGQWFGWLSVVPRAGVGGTYYSDTPEAAGGGDSRQRAFPELGVDTSFKLSRTWSDVHNQTLQINGLRHILQPFADYQFVPGPGNATNQLFQFDTVRQVPLNNGDLLSITRYSPLEFPAFNTIDAIDKMHVVRFGLRQSLQTQRDGQPWNLVELEGWTDYRIDPDVGQDTFSELFANLRLRPYDWLVWNTFTRYDYEQSTLPELNNELRVVHGDQWSVGVGTRYLKNDSNLVSLSGAVRLGRKWLAQTYQRFDMQDGTWEAQEYTLRQETHDWFITYGVRYQVERIGSNQMLVFLSVTLKAFPSIGLTSGRLGFGAD